MKQININNTFTIYTAIEELAESDQQLMSYAQEARKNAYAPYSKFQVGAAILLQNNQIVIGSNQENAAYPSGLCAERVAIYHAGAMYPNVQIIKIAIAGGTTIGDITNQPIPPCGACRQSMFEYEYKQQTPIEVLFMGEVGNIIQSNSVGNLLPLTFDKKLL